MVRYFKSAYRVPPAKCPNPACGKYIWIPTAADILCCFCRQAHFVHRSGWDWSKCKCGGDDAGCVECWGSGAVGTLAQPGK